MLQIFGTIKSVCPVFMKQSAYFSLGRIFKIICNYAKEKKIVIALEPNPKIYNTNFINKKKEDSIFNRLFK